MHRVAMEVNGALFTADVAPHLLLRSLLRDRLGLTGTHAGCETGQCGACVVLVDGRSVKSCTLLAVQADGTAVTTIEGLADGPVLHPMQEAFRRNHALQCGFCTPGVVLGAIDLAGRHPEPDEATIRSWLAGHLCRCTGYQPIVAAIAEGAAALRAFADR